LCDPDRFDIVFPHDESGIKKHHHQQLSFVATCFMGDGTEAKTGVVIVPMDFCFALLSLWFALFSSTLSPDV
jgi:hypothetical protein